MFNFFGGGGAPQKPAGRGQGVQRPPAPLGPPQQQQPGMRPGGGGANMGPAGMGRAAQPAPDAAPAGGFFNLPVAAATGSANPATLPPTSVGGGPSDGSLFGSLNLKPAAPGAMDAPPPPGGMFGCV